MPHGAVKPEIMHEENYNEADRRDHSKYNRRKTKNTGNGDKESWRMKRYLPYPFSYGDFFRQAPAMNPNREKITGVVCGVRVENVENPLMRDIRYLDKLVDELARGRAMEKILRE